jgi:hypothetical protein
MAIDIYKNNNNWLKCNHENNNYININNKKVKILIHKDKLIKQLYSNILDFSCDINHGCSISGLKSISNKTTKYTKKIKFNCEFEHEVFYLAFIEYVISDVVPYNSLKKNNFMLNYKQYNKIFKKTTKLIKRDCFICNILKNYNIKKSKLYKFYRIPFNNIYDPWVDIQLLKETNIKTKNSEILKTKKKEEDKLFVIYNNGINKIDCDNFHPIWKLYKNYITLEIVKELSIAGIYINKEIFIKKINDELQFQRIQETIFIIDSYKEPKYSIIDDMIIINDFNNIEIENIYKWIEQYKMIKINYSKYKYITIEKKNKNFELIFYYYNKKLNLNKIFV